MATSGTSCPRCGRPSPGGALCAGCERRSLLEALAAAVPGDPLRYLRQKVLDDGLTVAELARELAWDEGATRRLLKSAQRHLWMAERTRRLGQALNAWYRGSAAGILMNVLAIILGFGIASAWQARQDELRDLRGQLGVLNPLSEEVAFNASRAAELRPPADQPALCRIEGFRTDVWKRLSATAEVALLDTRLYDQVEAAYTDLDVALGPIGQQTMRGRACVAQLLRMHTTFEKLKESLDVSIESIRDNMRARAGEPATKALFNFVGRMLAYTVGILLLPGAIYWAMAAATRFVR